MFRSFATVLIVGTIAPVAHASDDCLSIWKEISESRQKKLKECLDRGGTCSSEALEYADSRKRLASCGPDAGSALSSALSEPAWNEPPPTARRPSQSPPPGEGEPRAQEADEKAREAQKRAADVESVTNKLNGTESPAPPVQPETRTRDFPGGDTAQQPTQPGVDAVTKVYGTKGTLEIGGSVGLTNLSEAVTPSGGSAVTTNTLSVSVGPVVGYYVFDGLELIGFGGVGISNGSSAASGAAATSSQTGITLGAGAGYAFALGAGGTRLEPIVGVEYVNVSRASDNGAGVTANTSASGVGLDLGVGFKVPIRSNALLAIGLEYVIFTGGISGSATSGGSTVQLSGSDSGGKLIGSVGFFVFFP